MAIRFYNDRLLMEADFYQRSTSNRGFTVNKYSWLHVSGMPLYGCGTKGVTAPITGGTNRFYIKNKIPLPEMKRNTN